MISRIARSFCSTRPSLSGHNKVRVEGWGNACIYRTKWSKIKEKKGLNDAKKNVAYTKARRDIMSAVRLGGGSADPEQNTILAATLRRLKDIPKENIQNALSRAISRRNQTGEDVIYHALAYNTVGLIIECTTGNPTRTIANIREILNDHGARFAPVGFMFDRKGSVKVLVDKTSEDHVEAMVEIALDNGAEDLDEIPSTDTETEIQFTCPPESVNKLTAALTAPGVCQTLLASEVAYTPVNPDSSAGTEDPDMGSKIADLVRDIEEDEDTRRVWTTFA
ncbi:YebC-like protein [Mycena sp. CBHHK59/15]|nr:YebC-like protein [Mycena sp. CBHHK59/15]